jgi:hypothetical protein
MRSTRSRRHQKNPNQGHNLNAEKVDQSDRLGRVKVEGDLLEIMGDRVGIGIGEENGVDRLG